MNISIVIIALFLALALYLGIRSTRGKEMSLDQWAVGGRGFGTLFIFLLTAGEVYTTFSLLGGSGWAYSKGVAAFYVPTYIFLGYVIAYWLAPKVWEYGKKHQIISQPDFYVSKFKSRALGVFVAILGAVALVPYIVIQFRGLGIIVSEASYGAISPIVASCIGTIVVTIYVMISGIHGSAWTSVIKDFMILIVVVFLGLYIPFHYFGGIQPMFEAVHTVKPELLTLADQGLSSSWFISTVLISAIGFYIMPTTFMVVLSANSRKTLVKNTISLPLYTLLLLFVFFVGFAATVQIPGLQGAEGDLSLLKLAIATFDPWIVGLIGAAGLLTALVPTSIMLMSVAIGLTKNVYKVMVPSVTDQKLTLVSKLIILMLSAISLYFTITGGEALAILNIMAYSLIVQLAPSLYMSVMNMKYVNIYGAFAGMIVGVLVVLYTTITNQTMGTMLPSAPQVIKDLNIGIIGLVINLIIMLLVSAFTKKLTQRDISGDKLNTNTSILD